MTFLTTNFLMIFLLALMECAVALLDSSQSNASSLRESPNFDDAETALSFYDRHLDIVETASLLLVAGNLGNIEVLQKLMIADPTGIALLEFYKDINMAMSSKQHEPRDKSFVVRGCEFAVELAKKFQTELSKE